MPKVSSLLAADQTINGIDGSRRVFPRAHSGVFSCRRRSALSVLRNNAACVVAITGSGAKQLRASGSACVPIGASPQLCIRGRDAVLPAFVSKRDDSGGLPLGSIDGGRRAFFSRDDHVAGGGAVMGAFHRSAIRGSAAQVGSPVCTGASLGQPALAADAPGPAHADSFRGRPPAISPAQVSAPIPSMAPGCSPWPPHRSRSDLVGVAI